MRRVLTASVSALFLVGLLIWITNVPDGEEQARLYGTKRALVQVKPELYDEYAGTYQLPSGALFTVTHKNSRLMAGVPPYELLPQTTRRFASNRIFGKIIFERAESGPAQRVNLWAAEQDMWAQRVEPEHTIDPTQMTDAGGHRLRMLVTGNGSPTIVIEDGLGSSIRMRSKFQAELSEFARVITYDHAGTGGSEAGPNPRHAVQVAHELRTALQNAKIDPPFIMVGGSIGADYISVFAQEYPQDVAGLIRLDPPPDFDAWYEWMKVNVPSEAEPFKKMLPLMNCSIMEMMKYQTPGRQAEWAAIRQTRKYASNSLPLPNIPVIQITGSAGYLRAGDLGDSVKARFFDDWLRKHIPNAKHVFAVNSGHAVYAGDPELVVGEIRQLVNMIRQDKSQ